jgi:hypothetical protein
MAGMHNGGPAIGRAAQLRLFVASLWLTLATALFCAMVPAGLPHSAAHGSAFNPANSAVALHASSNTNRAVLKRIAGDDPAPPTSSGAGLAVSGAVFDIAGLLLASSAPHVAALAPIPVFAVRVAAYPRGPPLA